MKKAFLSNKLEEITLFALSCHPVNLLNCIVLRREKQSYLPVTVRNRYLSYMTFPRYNSRTITSREVYLEELEKVYQQGYALDNEEELSGVICVGAPVLNYTGYPCGSIWISGPKDRLTEEQLRSTVQIVKEIAGQISAELGYRRV